jgi:DNA phosphorothioation-dependent restriction protein DptF
MEIVMDNYTQENTENRCLVEMLSRLKESSLEAVESSKRLNSLTKYMHVTRPVQKEFDNILKNASATDKAELILLCGSVGDGKSHLLSYYNDNYPELMSNYQIHNDSTASFYINKPAVYTLREVLNDFTDVNLLKSKKKLVLAINLGTLNNFIEADNENEFLALKEFVKKEKILEESISAYLDDNVNSNFHYVNFTDYHLYSLAENEPTSSYIENLIVKIIDDVEDNPFRNEYNKCCRSCSSNSVCPIRANYEMLFDQAYRDGLIQLLIESIVKNKLIVSTRAFINLIYEMIIDERYINTGSLEPRKEILKLSPISYCKALTASSIFSREESSAVINSLRELDPVDVRNEEIDTFIVEFTNKDGVLDIFREFLPELQSYLKKFSLTDFTENSSLPLRQELLKLFIRSYGIFRKNVLFYVKDQLYYDYMKNLYYWNCGEKIKLREAYNIVKQAALNWNGNSDSDEMLLTTNSLQTKYKISQKIEIKQSLGNVVARKESEIERFSNTLYMNYVNEKSGQKFEIEVDYSLYSLLNKIVEGYRPNMKDKSINVKFSNFVEKVSHVGSMSDTLFIKEKIGNIDINYKLEFSSDFGYTFEVV